MISSFLYVAQTENTGLGVFASADIEAGTIIESSPVLVMKKEDRKLLDQTVLHDYIFEWGEKKEMCCVGLGYISIYNHSYTSNCEYKMDFANKTISIVAVRNIESGEEIFINYNGDWNDSKPVWFDVK